MDYHLADLSSDILIGIVNEHLRLTCEDKQALFYDLDIPGDQLEKKLKDAGYTYDSVSNQYREMK
ncbi:conserved protein of unknown function [Shewanella benthica]|uniref:DUF4250 domain-containing protein n=1 Tax=Shewanella benthica TaxID=43661 RepID=A0A330M2F7_9GAMM|nr:DUF4250 domain-containing protein [Shewanella benthica]MBE7216728.1 DUF4250 domain-containing protein [Shewanella benthica]MCL1061599.1 DUF4250 domain-containing protein [Shewanella benthica]SQH76215.1 conserved protein of unknown function [Shewanella benthica]